MKSLTGNIYKERFSDQGKRYTNHYVDCAECGREIGIDTPGRWHTITNYVKYLGWRKSPQHGKWVCPDCILAIEEKNDVSEKRRAVGSEVAH